MEGRSWRWMVCSKGCVCDTVDTLQKWKDVRNAYIMSNWGDICNNADISKISKIRAAFANPAARSVTGNITIYQGKEND